MLADGRCLNNRNQLIGFVNANDATAGTSSEDYLGKAVVQVLHFFVLVLRICKEDFKKWICKDFMKYLNMFEF